MLSNIKIYYCFIIHLLFLLTVFFCLYFVGFFKSIPTESSMVQWDAGWYKSIVDKGYFFQENVQSNTGFFPLFPYIWKFSGLSSVGISVFNYLMFLIGVSFISKTLPKLKSSIVLLSLSLPSLFFMYVPYSEALFFFTASLYLYGNYKSNIYIKIIALLLSSLARPTILFFLPAVIFSEFCAKSELNSKIRSIVIYTIVIFGGTFISFYFVGFSSDNLFAYSDSQINNWEHNFSLPTFPLTTWRGYRILWLDLFGLWIVISSLLGSVVYFVKVIKNRMNLNLDKNLLLSLSYLSMVLIYVLFFHPKEESTGLTSVLSLNRYVFCSPFVFYLMYYYFENNKTNINLVLSGALVLVLALIGFPIKEVVGLTYLKTLVFVLLVVVFLIAQILPKLTKSTLVYSVIYVMNITLQVYLFQSFLKGNWVG